MSPLLVEGTCQMYRKEFAANTQFPRLEAWTDENFAPGSVHRENALQKERTMGPETDPSTVG